MVRFKMYKTYISSAGYQIYIEVIYPDHKTDAAIIMAHGLRSFFPGFFNNFSNALVRAGYMVVKFHFVGTGLSAGKFEDKLNSVMLQNLKDVVQWTKTLPNVKKIGMVARSNAVSLAILHGYDPYLHAYALLAPSVFMRHIVSYYLTTGKKSGNYLLHTSFSRPHTKGIGRLPLKYFKELAAYDRVIPHRIKEIKRAICFQSKRDELASADQRDFAYCAQHLPKPACMVLVDAKTHSFHGKQSYVIKETIRWFHRYL
ncbi:MAG: CocE/NonD family hydrolase [Patescibacteria group bacterium]